MCAVDRKKNRSSSTAHILACAVRRFFEEKNASEQGTAGNGASLRSDTSEDATTGNGASLRSDNSVQMYIRAEGGRSENGLLSALRSVDKTIIYIMGVLPSYLRVDLCVDKKRAAQP